MNFTVSGNEYKLRLTSSSIVEIEKKLGKSIFAALENIQDNLVETIVTILWGSMQALNSGVNLEKVYKIYDEYIDEGHSIEDLIQEINTLFEVSGFFKKGQA